MTVISSPVGSVKIIITEEKTKDVLTTIANNIYQINKKLYPDTNQDKKCYSCKLDKFIVSNKDRSLKLLETKIIVKFEHKPDLSSTIERTLLNQDVIRPIL